MSIEVVEVELVARDERGDITRIVGLEDPVIRSVLKISMTPGSLGCSYSHIQVLKIARERGYKNIMILEDDFNFIDDKYVVCDTINHFMETFGENYSVFLLAINTEKHEKCQDPKFARILKGRIACGYIVNFRYYDTLISNFETGVMLLEKTGDVERYAVDMFWQKLQQIDVWYAPRTQLGYQRQSFSDIEHGVYFYKCFGYIDE